MWGIEQKTPWHSLSNPFTNDRREVIAGHVSCRSTEINDIIAGQQNAVILAGRPNIGKSTLIRYLNLPSTAPWSWRNELEVAYDREMLDTIRFAQIDLKPLLVGFREENKLLDIFVEECTRALYRAYNPDDSFSFSDHTLRGLYKLLNTISADATNDTRYFLILDNIERLGELYMQLSNIQSGTKRPQEYGITLLDRCRAIRTIVDLINEFRLFGFILSIESLPKARVVDQFTYISADLARFTTKTLQTFTLRDTAKFLAQSVNDFRGWQNGPGGASEPFDDTPLFSQEEQTWVLALAGTHPYLLQQCCYYLFQFKAFSAENDEPQGSYKEQLLSIIYEQVGTFLSRTWRRLQEAIKNSTGVERVERQFQAFISLCAQNGAEHTIDYSIWESLDPELRYILSSEGIVRSDLFRPIHYPGTILRDFLVQQTKVGTGVSQSVQERYLPSEHGHWLRITRPGMETKQVSLSKLEYRLLKTLLQHADACTEQELIQGAWEKGTERANFAQRLYKLRKKLEENLDGIDIIENRYGGNYSLVHPDWLELD